MTDFNQNEQNSQIVEKEENASQAAKNTETDTARSTFEAETNNNAESSTTYGTDNAETNSSIVENTDKTGTKKKTKTFDRKNIQLSRHIIQLISFFLFPALFINIYHSLRDIVYAISHGNFRPEALSSQLVLTIGILLVTILWGRFFCGYLCSFGAISDLLYFISEKILPKKPKMPSLIDKWLKWLKYAILIYLIVGVWILSLSFSASFSPWNTFGILISGNLARISTVFATVGFLLLIAIAIGSFFIERFFCRYLCPLGAIFSAVSRKRFFKIHRRTDTCNDCANCSRHCSMGIEIHKKEKVDSGECIDCMQCISACPNSCFESSPAPVVTGTAAAVVIAGLVTATGMLPGASASKEAPARAEQKIGRHSGNDNYGPGSDDHNGPNFRGGNKNFHGKPYFNGDNNSNGRFPGKGNDDPDNGSYPGKDNDDPNNGSYPGKRNDDPDNGSYPGKGNDNPSNGSHFGKRNRNSDKGSSSGNGDSSPGKENGNNSGKGSTNNSAKTSDIDLSKVNDGTYSGTGNGFRGEVKVKVTVKDHKITDISIESHGDDKEFFNKASASIIDSIISSQSLDVDAVSGATFSSNGILEAVADALKTS